MKPKKTPRADLRSRRALFFEFGLIVSIVAAISVFSVGQMEKTVEDISEKFVEPPEILPPVSTKQPPPPKVKPMAYNALVFNVRPNDAVITGGDMEFPDPGDIVIEIPKVGNEKPEDDIPLYVSEVMPTFEGGGIENFRQWVFSQIEYPRIALDNHIQGRVTVRFVIERDGSLSNIEVLAAPDRSLTDETVRVLENSPKWNPGLQRNKPVRVWFVIPVDYRIYN